MQLQLYIKYMPSLNIKFHSKNAALIFQKLEYWSSKYPNKGFYKFLEPCEKNPLYRVGDSWSEELGISRVTFNKSFEKFGIRYRSKSEFLRTEDKFQGNAYASYYDRKTNRMYFIRNNEAADKLLANISPQSKARSCTERNFRSFTHAKSYLNLKQRKTSSLKSEKKSISTYNQKIVQKMEEVWKNEIGELGVERLSDYLKTRLCATLKDSFENDISKWEAYCKKIASSKFLMGEAGNKFFKKAWITWALKPENIERIRAGDFQIGDRRRSEQARQPSQDEVLEIIHKQPLSLQNFVEKIAQQVGNSKFVAWFRQIEFSSQETYMVCQAPSRFIRDYIREKFQGILENLSPLTLQYRY